MGDAELMIRSSEHHAVVRLFVIDAMPDSRLAGLRHRVVFTFPAATLACHLGSSQCDVGVFSSICLSFRFRAARCGTWHTGSSGEFLQYLGTDLGMRGVPYAESGTWLYSKAACGSVSRSRSPATSLGP